MREHDLGKPGPNGTAGRTFLDCDGLVEWMVWVSQKRGITEMPDERVNILMVDDQPAKLLSYEVILAELGENLLKATSGTEALEQLLKTDIAVVLMDVSMPDLDGFELADLIRQHPRFQRTAIIFISAVYLT